MGFSHEWKHICVVAFVLKTQAIDKDIGWALRWVRGYLRSLLLPSAEDVQSSVLYSSAEENLSFLLFEQELEGMVWLYSVSSFILFVF